MWWVKFLNCLYRLGRRDNSFGKRVRVKRHQREGTIKPGFEKWPWISQTAKGQSGWSGG